MKKRILLIVPPFVILSLVGGLTFATSPAPTNEIIITTGTTEKQIQDSKHILINLNTNTLTLHERGTIVKTMPLVSQGKPGSYYETIGGSYISDYKSPLQFSSLGHVYMPYSVHIFGNYFIHGIPYYPDGKEVSSTYSGGCLRLANNDAAEVYNFVEEGTPIIVTKNTDKDFIPTPASGTPFVSQKMTTFMVGAISLETQNQEEKISSPWGTLVSKKELLPYLLQEGDPRIIATFTQDDRDLFLKQMNKKAKALGLSNTSFNDTVSAVETTYEDYERFMDYMNTYKSYLGQESQKNIAHTK